jgi:hypothetical protein
MAKKQRALSSASPDSIQNVQLIYLCSRFAADEGPLSKGLFYFTCLVLKKANTTDPEIILPALGALLNLQVCSGSKQPV